jgi:hypothetical protein
MEPNLDGNSLHFNEDRRARSSRARAIPYGSYTETVAARALIGLAVVAGATVSILALSQFSRNFLLR